MANAFFSDLLSTISERGRTLLRRRGSSDGRPDASELLELCEALLSGRGEASGIAIARDVFDGYHELDAAGRQSFFAALARDFGPDREKLSHAIESWRAEPSDDDASGNRNASASSSRVARLRCASTSMGWQKSLPSTAVRIVAESGLLLNR